VPALALMSVLLVVAGDAPSAGLVAPRLSSYNSPLVAVDLEHVEVTAATARLVPALRNLSVPQRVPA
jgi:hypothetical protein